MRGGTIILLLVSLALAGLQTEAAARDAASAAPAEDMRFKTLELEMDPRDAEVLFRKEPYDTSAFPVAMLEEGGRIPGMVEVMGNFSRNFLKKSILIKLQKGRTWQGRRKISLRSMNTDPSFMREWLTWNLISSLGMVAPEVQYYRLNINKQYIGLFLYIEWIEPSMFDRFGLGADGEFYNVDDEVYCGDMSPANQTRLKECWRKLFPKDGDYASLRKLIDGINETPVEDFDRFLEKNFDVDSVINWLVVNTIISNGDTYNKNYFMYLSKKTGKWLVIPFDFDLSFGRNADPVLPFPHNILNDNYTYFYTPELGSPNPLKEKTLRNPRLFERVKGRFSHVLGVKRELRRQQGLARIWKDDTPLGGFAWFRPDEFQGLVSALERAIGRDLQKERYPGAKGRPFAEEAEALRLYNEWRHPLLKKTLLDPTPFGTAHWLPYAAFPPLTPADKGAKPRRQTVPLTMSVTEAVEPGEKKKAMVDELLARTIGFVSVRKANMPARVRLEVETERAPETVPPGIDPSKCIERTWHLDLKTRGAKLTVDLQLDYLEESSLRNEIGAGVKDESGLSLWVLRDNMWRKLKTAVNPISNVLATQGVELAPAEVLRLVACSD